MNKMNVEITAEGYEISTTINGVEYKQKHVMDGKRSCTQVSGVNFESMDDEIITDDLYEALESFFCFDVARALQDYED